MRLLFGGGRRGSGGQAGDAMRLRAKVKPSAVIDLSGGAAGFAAELSYRDVR